MGGLPGVGGMGQRKLLGRSCADTAGGTGGLAAKPAHPVGSCGGPGGPIYSTQRPSVGTASQQIPRTQLLRAPQL